MMSHDSPQRAPLRTLTEIQPNSFIFEQPNALPDFICQDIIQRFEAHQEEQYRGRIGQTANEDAGVKKTTDLVVSGKPHWKDVDNNLFRSLGIALREFREAFPYFKGPFKDMGYGIQRYVPGEYYHWHIDGGSHEFSQRQLVALWYLNDVPGPGGETEFLFQQVKVRPEQGKLILFPLSGPTNTAPWNCMKASNTSPPPGWYSPECPPTFV